MLLGLIASLTLLAAGQLPPTAPPRDPVPRTAARPSTTGTASIRGRVTDRASGQPLARVTVRLFSQGAARPAEPLATRTDADGRYEFTRLPASTYTVNFEPEEYTATHLRSSFGATRPSDPMMATRPKTIELNAGETAEADGSLWRALAIEGRVLNEFGQPMANVIVSASRWDMAPASFMSSRQTDDRGAFRVFGLSPGSYRVCANPRTGMEMRGPLAVAESERPLRTCFPGSVSDDGAQPVTLEAADLIGVDVRIQRGRVYSVAGIALDGAGAPLVGGSVNLVRLEPNGSSSSSSGLEVNQGQFIGRGLPPGDYAIRAEIGGPMNWQDKREREVGYLPFRIDNADAEGLVVQVTKAAKVTGRVIFEEGPPDAPPASMRVTVRPDGAGMMMGPPPNVTVKPDLTFELDGLFGPMIVQVFGQPRPWVVKAIRYRGADIFGRPVDFKSGELEVVLSNRGAVVSGTVDSTGRDPAEIVVVQLIPTDATRSRNFPGNQISGMVKDGKFEMPPVRAGEYFAIAVTVETSRRLTYPGAGVPPEQLAQIGERITLGEGERKAVALRVGELK